MAKMAGLAAEGITNLHDYIQGRMDEREDLLSALEKERLNAERAQDIEHVKFVEHLINYVKVQQFKAD